MLADRRRGPLPWQPHGCRGLGREARHRARRVLRGARDGHVHPPAIGRARRPDGHRVGRLVDGAARGCSCAPRTAAAASRFCCSPRWHRRPRWRPSSSCPLLCAAPAGAQKMACDAAQPRPQRRAVKCAGCKGAPVRIASVLALYLHPNSDPCSRCNVDPGLGAAARCGSAERRPRARACFQTGA